MRPVPFAFAIALAMCPGVVGAVEPMHPDPDPASSQSSPPAPVVPRRTWYGGQILLADAFGIALSFAGVVGLYENGFSGAAALPVSFVGLLGYALASPVIHGVHGQAGFASLSLLMRLSLPVIGTFAGSAVGDGSSSCTNAAVMASAEHGPDACTNATLSAGILGGLVAMGIVTGFDAALLAWDDREPPSPSRDPSATPGLQWTPVVSAVSDAGRRSVPVLGIGGMF
jgi:hypothetical protein